MTCQSHVDNGDTVQITPKCRMNTFLSPLSDGGSESCDLNQKSTSGR